MKKVLSWILCLALLMTSVALAEEVVASPSAEDAAALAGEMAYIIDFEDENFAFLGMDTAAGNADASELSVVDYNGSKALRVDVKAKVPYVSFNIEELLGENYSALAAITFDVGAELGPDGKFYAQSGKVYTVTGTDAVKTGYDWSVYLKSKNPKTATITLNPDVALTPGQGEYLMITKEADACAESGKFDGEEPRDIFIDNIQFLDAEGNPLPINLGAVWTAPATEEDRTNLAGLNGAVEFPGFACEGGAWGQNGFSMPEDFRAALVPGAVIEISYESESGDMWLVFPDSAAGWMRVQMMSATTNASKTVAQITYEQCAAVLGEDTSTWGDLLQCEASGNWKVYSVKVGQSAPRMALSNVTEFPGFTCEGGAWGQNGFEFTPEVLDALQPGTALEIDFESESGDMWILLPDSAAGWMRVQMMSATVIGNKAYITYEQIVEVVGEDKAGWGARLQCEASGNWSVYAVNVGKVNNLVGVANPVELAGFSKSAGAWSQDGIEMTPEFLAALVPGSVINISYESETGNIWIVMPDSAAGWMRVQQGTADCDGKVAQITFEEMAAVLGEDVSTWGARLQCESDSNWSVYAITVGTAY